MGHAQGVAPSIVLYSPSAFQLFQRDGDTGSIILRGHVDNAGVYTVSASWNGLESGVLWQGDTPDFETEWSALPVWQSDLSVTIAGETLLIPSVGIGDVFVIAGQSNAMGMGKHYQMYTGTLGLRGGMYTKNGWQELTDPTGYVADGHARGSQWPLLATYVLNYGVPVAFIPTAVSATSIEQWKPGQRLFQKLTDLIDSLPQPTVRALLWQQGEADVNMTARRYADDLELMADEIHDLYGIPMIAAYLYHNTSVNAGIKIAVSERDYILYGADLHDLPRDKPPHYVSDESLQAEAWRWWVSLSAYFYPMHAP